MWYILNKRNKPIYCKDVYDYHKWENKYPDRRIVKQENIGEIRISTVFLGLDHGFPRNDVKPVLWETMVFNGEHDNYQERYTSYADAYLGHDAVVDMVKKSIKNGK